ncbi:M23 family metallopeptidase [Anaeromyxobacter sp. Red801]|uniref:M23 family metallopeptidase n=1 Tax=Anaeromyxobacter sp. Red801 TaxID=3411632 RepID=UPI003BA2BC39
MVSLSIDPPPHRPGHTPRPGARRAGLGLALGVALVAGIVLGRLTAPGGRFAIGGSSPGDAAPAAQAPAPSAPAGAAQQAAAAPAAAAPDAGATAAAPAPAPAAAPAPAPAAPAGPRRVVATLSGALEESIQRALPPEDRDLGEQLTQVVNRLLVWDLRVARDGRKGDRIEILYSPPAPAAQGLPASGEPVVEAVRFASQKLGRVFAAYRFQPEGARWARYYRPDGTELEELLVDAPIHEYDQVTSLLRDGRRHKGVDFRTPTGTPVFATFDGVIERRNWNFAGNGNCLDIRDPASGRHAIFLHLEVLPKDMVPGRRVKKGEQIALSGNTGHSTAPHLHYQLEAPDGRVLDPFEIHKIRHAALDPARKPAFDARRTALDAALGGAVAATQAPAAVPATPAALPAAR